MDGRSEEGAVVRISRPAEGIVQLTLFRPDRLNAIDESVIEGLHAALDEVQRDTACRVVVLTGAGRGFCAGFDMRSARGDDFADRRHHPVSATLRGQYRLADMIRKLRALRPPVVAAVNGAAAGGGFALALAADVRIAASGAVFLVANVKIGLSGGEMGIAYLLPRVVGTGRAAELMLSGRAIGADEALRWGLVNEVTDDALEGALEFARAVSGNSPFGIEMTKELLTLSATGVDLDTVLALENRSQVLASLTEEMATAVAAFRERGRGPARDAEEPG